MSNTRDIGLAASHAASGREHTGGGTPSPEDTARATKIIAQSIVRALLAQGHQAPRLVSLAAELVEAITLEIQHGAHRSQPPDSAAQSPRRMPR